MADKIPWIKEFYKIDQFTFDFILESNPIISGNTNYYEILDSLAQLKILPEHYLNQTQLEDEISPDLSHSSWEVFSKKAFGTGLMKLSNFTENIESTLNVFNDCWWINPLLTQDNSLNWENRFGNFINSPNNLRIRIIDDKRTTYLEFEAGKLDLLDYGENVPKLHPNEVTKNIYSKPTSRLNLIVFNMRPNRSYIGDPEPCELHPEHTKGWAIRKAISYAINREEINEVIYGGEIDLNNYPISPSLSKWLHPNMIAYCQNYDYAKKFVDIAGYSLCWYTYPTPEGFPNWEYACSPIVEPSTISVNFYYYFAIFGVIGIIIIRRRKKIEEK
jgi:ABC-type transport system substrate-binding protein